MAFSIKWKRPSPWQDVDLMQLVPVKARQSETDPDSGKVTLLIPRYESWPLNLIIQPRLGPQKRYLRVKLDDRGSYLWPNLDGKRTIGDLVPAFQARFPDDQTDVPQRLGAYVFQLFQNKFVKFLNLPK